MAYFAQAAKEANVDGIVNMSQISARENSKSHAARDHWLSERVFDWSGLNVVEKIGGQPPMTVEQFVEKHRTAFV
jgi:uncharacterized protein YbjT (DUF2867 family)